MTFAPKKALAVAALSMAAIVGTTATTTTSAQANEFVAGAIGFTAGAIVGSAVTQAHQPRVVYQTQPVYQPQPVVVHARPAPWTPAWYSYCSSRYRSFNPQTGYFLAYSGNHIFCQ
ncbi:MAG: BA14K family protein [Devosiaceae bacterium]